MRKQTLGDYLWEIHSDIYRLKLKLKYLNSYTGSNEKLFNDFKYIKSDLDKLIIIDTNINELKEEYEKCKRTIQKNLENNQ